MHVPETVGPPAAAATIRPWSALVVLIAGPVVLVGSVLVFLTRTPGNLDLLAAGAAGTGGEVWRIVGGRASEYADAARLAWLPVAGLLVAGLTACHLGRHVFWTARARTAAEASAIAALVAGLCALVAALVLVGLLGTPATTDGDTPARVLQALTLTATATGAAAAIVAGAAWVVTARRLLLHGWRLVRPRGHELAPDAVLPPGHPSGCSSGGRPHVGGSPTTRWDDARRVPPTRRPGEVGICASGGGIRSACLTLGTLQALREEGELARARYLVSVSGGGYMAGAFQLALQPPPDPLTGPNVATPEDVFSPGSAEEDHLRRHSHYIADSVGQWVVALAVLLRGVVVSLTIVLLTVAGAGLAIAVFYAGVPLIDLGGLRPRFVVPPDSPAPGFPAIPAGVHLAVGVLLAAALLMFLLEVAVISVFDRQLPPLSQAAWGLFGIAVLVGLVGVAVPALVWASARVTWAVPMRGAVSTATGGALGTVLLTYVATLIGVMWRKRESIGRSVGMVRRLLGGRDPGAGQRAVPSSLAQRLIVFAVLVGLGLVFLVVLGWVASTAPWWPWWGPGLVLAGLAFSAILLDQTWLGLHPFYRRQLASAFAVRRVRARDGGRVQARAYDFVGERTRLSRYGQPPPGFPQVIFAAAANLSGSDRTPPGRRAVSFTLSHDYLGGPDVGWVRSDELEREVSGHLQRDLTVQAAMAISGAAFASAMGRQARAFQTFFALSNARLGAWLPNPAFLAQRAAGSGTWTRPRLPWVRRLSYLLREITGRYLYEDRLLFCTDGGHYENLGLVELLRHGCRTVYCIDASGDAPPLAATLSEAITLAREELGVEITLHEPLDLVPGGADPLQPAEPLAGLSGRLSREAVRTGAITYPRPLEFGDGPPAATGRLIVLKASLTAALPYDLLAYAARHPVFPRDSTGDQWFDHGQFDAYQTLGRELGRWAVQAARDVGAAPPVPTAEPAPTAPVPQQTRTR